MQCRAKQLPAASLTSDLLKAAGKVSTPLALAPSRFPWQTGCCHMAAPPPCICLQQLKTCQSWEGKTRNFIWPGQAFSPVLWSKFQSYRMINSDLCQREGSSKLSQGYKHRNGEVKVEAWAWSKFHWKSVHKKKQAVYLKAQDCVLRSRCSSIQENCLYFSSQVNTPLNITNSILKSCSEDVQLFKNQDNLT